MIFLKIQGLYMLNSHRGRQIIILVFIKWMQDMHHDKVSWAFGIKIAPYHHIPFTIEMGCFP